MNGWIKLHRKILEWEWLDDPNTAHLFIVLLLLANHKDTKWRGEIIKKGQLLTGLKKLSKISGISTQSLRTSLERLKSTSEITNKSTNRFRIITLVNWDKYQLIENQPTSNLTSKLTINQQATNKQLTSSKNDKKVKNDNNIRNKNKTATLIVADDVNKIFDIFYKTVNPALNWGNKTQRTGAQWLVDKVGIDRAVKITQYACSVQGKQYAPTITTPYKLKEKFGDLMIYYKKNNSKREVVKVR